MLNGGKERSRVGTVGLRLAVPSLTSLSQESRIVYNSHLCLGCRLTVFLKVEFNFACVSLTLCRSCAPMCLINLDNGARVVCKASVMGSAEQSGRAIGHLPEPFRDHWPSLCHLHLTFLIILPSCANIVL